MKKLAILFAMVFVVSMAMGQSNESVVTVNGSGNSADIEQIGANNKSVLLQSNGNVFELLQQGQLNNSNLRQVANGSNEAYVNQVGDENNLSWAGGALQGTNNLLNLDQEGDGNDAFVYQDFKDHVMDIDQLGNDNEFRGHQDAPGSNITVYQDGNDNMAKLQQADGNNSADVYQFGNDNKVYNPGGWLEMAIQDGDGNFMDIDQLGSVNTIVHSQIGDLNSSIITQNGDNNTTTVHQSHQKLLFTMK